MNVTRGMAILHDRVVVMIQPDSDAKEKHLEICLTPFWQGAEQSFIPATLDLNKTCSFCQRIVENRQNHCRHLSPWWSNRYVIAKVRLDDGKNCKGQKDPTRSEGFWRSLHPVVSCEKTAPQIPGRGCGRIGMKFVNFIRCMSATGCLGWCPGDGCLFVARVCPRENRFCGHGRVGLWDFWCAPDEMMKSACVAMILLSTR